MPYPTLPSARRIHYEINGTVVGENTSGFGAGLITVLSGAQMLALDEETSTIDSAIIATANTGSVFVFVIFPELVDLSNFISRWVHSSDSGGTVSLSNLASSTNTTNGADGTWTTMGTSGTIIVSQNYTAGDPAPDWWRSTSPGTLTSNNTGIIGVRFELTTSGANNASLRNLYLWGHKHSGQTPNDIIFLESDGVTEWSNDDDWGDIGAGTTASTHTYYVQNTAVSLTAHTITVKSSGSDNGKWTVSLNNISFGSSQTITSLAPGATQVVYFKFTPPSPAAGNYRPYAAYLEADVASWS